MNPLPSFLWMHSYLLQEETRVDRSHKMESAHTLLASVGSSAGTPAGTPTGAVAAALVTTNSYDAYKPQVQRSASSPPKGRDHRKKRKQSDGHSHNNSGLAARKPAL
jgi:hypothetical protein